MVRRREVEDPPGTDDARKLFDGRPYRIHVHLARLLDRFYEDQEGVIGMPAEGARLLLVPGLVILLVLDEERLLGMAIRKHVRDEQPAGGGKQPFVSPARGRPPADV